MIRDAPDFLLAYHARRSARGITVDKGGEANLSTVEKHLIENFAGIAVVINDINARLLLGEEVDLLELCTLSSTSVRSRAGWGSAVGRGMTCRSSGRCVRRGSGAALERACASRGSA